MLAASAAASALATVVLMVLFGLSRVDVWPIYLLLLVRSLGGAFHHPAMPRRSKSQELP